MGSARTSGGGSLMAPPTAAAPVAWSSPTALTTGSGIARREAGPAASAANSRKNHARVRPPALATSSRRHRRSHDRSRLHRTDVAAGSALRRWWASVCRPDGSASGVAIAGPTALQNTASEVAAPLRCPARTATGRGQRSTTHGGDRYADHEHGDQGEHGEPGLTHRDTPVARVRIRRAERPLCQC